MSIEKERLLSLIEFAQHSARLKLNPIQDVSNHKIFHRFEHDLIGLPGMHFNIGGDQEEIWLAIDRLVETKSPTPKDQILMDWLDISNNPEKEPLLKNAIESPGKNIGEQQKSLVLISEYPKKDEIEQKYKKYISAQWMPWSIEEKKRRRTIKLYSELFTIKQQLEGSISDSAIELVWGIGIGVWKDEKINIKYPILTQLVELSLNEKKMTIEIRPRQTEVQLESDVYVSIDNPGIADLEKAFKETQIKQTQVFSPFDRITYESHLQIAVTHLDPRGMYWPNQTTTDDRKLPIVDQELKITDTWVLFARPRSKSQFIQDLERFKNRLDKDDVVVNGVAEELVKEPNSEHVEVNTPNFRGLSSLGSSYDNASEIMDLYFPLPFNEEQVNIIKMLECSKGVVVQGPPGTGKTHSIANIISHYMACGKRVLVTSMKEPALSVLKEKLPETIQPLAIAILTNEQEGMKQFEFAVSKIAHELQAIDRKSLSREIEQGEQYIDQLHAKLASLDRSITDWAKNNIRPFVCDGKTIYPEDAAREVKSAIGMFEWLEDDISINPEHDLKIDHDDIIILREARREVKNDLIYLNAFLPEIDVFPEIEDLLRLHHDTLQLMQMSNILKNDNYPILINKSEETFNYLDDLFSSLNDLEKINNQISTENMVWSDPIKHILKNSNENQLIQLFENLINQISQSITEKNEFLAEPIILPALFELNEGLTQAILNKSEGRSAFGLIGILGKGKYKKILNDIRIVNRKPVTKDDWSYIYKFIMLQVRINEILIRWNSLADQLYLPQLDICQFDASIKEAEKISNVYNLIKNSVKLEKNIYINSKHIFPDWQFIDNIIKNLEITTKFQNAVNLHIKIKKLSYTVEARNKLNEKMSKFTGQISEEIKLFLSEIGLNEINESQFKSKWFSLIEELNRVLSFRGHFSNIKNICERISESGAQQWAFKLSNKPMYTELDDLLPSNWQQAWRCRRLENYLRKSNCFDEFKALIYQRSQVEKILSKSYQNMVANRTWLQLANNATPDIRAALQAFQAAIARIGKGTGKRAIRYRKDAQNAASLTNKAVPCWIMPHYRVSESLPPEFGCFDLVIIDEASQSDLNALPAILRANKILIVGDDKQVSPDGVGLEEDKINNLMAKYLFNQVGIYKQAMSPERSIYDLCKVVFADSHVMLREHFRCVSPIIEYSKREFYNHELKPLRLPKQSERLDPPLIDVIINDGFRKNKFNEAEGRFIVDEIKKICSDPRMENRTIGIVSLLGNEQSRKIWEMIQNEISFEIQTKHKIKCGDALTFQGEQRCIMFLSMVVTKDNNQASSREAFAQRFNVAASRARDRMYLVRSVELDDLSPADKLRRQLIEHFSSPFAQDELEVKNLRELCESPFEEEIFDLLTERGYRVVPQVVVGSYRIDMVVEGHNDARLAIECDGDRYHDASKWDDDMNRQRILERAGWVFWRCFASTFTLNRDNVMADLIKTLTQMGIGPIGSNEVMRNIHTEQRRIKIYGDVIIPSDLPLEEGISVL